MPRVAKWVGDAMESLMASKMPLMRVIETVYLNPYIKKIRFQGNLSGMNFQLGYAVIIRVSDTEFRNYTASFSDVKNGILEIIFHIHGNGPGSLYIDNLKVGNEIRISMPRGKKQFDPYVKQHFFFGDETSLGLACAFQSFLKENLHQFQFYFELEESNNGVPQSLGLENYTVFSRKNKNEKWISDLPIFKTPGWNSSNFVLTGNVKSVQAFRRFLRSRNVTGKILSTGYWLEGKKGL